MRLEIGKCYARADGRGEEIRGYAKHAAIDGENIVWSLAGNWYGEDSGRFVQYGMVRRADAEPCDMLPKAFHWAHFFAKGPTHRDLVKETPEEI